MEHPNRNSQGYVFEHILVAEAAMGKYLGAGHPVHHVNGDPSDNRPENLVVCEDAAYHALIHERMRAKEATGNPRSQKCVVCKQWDVPENMTLVKNRGWYHKPCDAARAREYRRNLRGKANH